MDISSNILVCGLRRVASDSYLDVLCPVDHGLQIYFSGDFLEHLDVDGDHSIRSVLELAATRLAGQ